MANEIALLSIVQENLETFHLIWLDASVNDSSENVEAQHQLRTSINFLKTFDNDEECEQYIKSVLKDDRIVFIVSGRFGQIIVPRIHSLRQVSDIYVYCKNKTIHEVWANQFKKVRRVIVLLDELISLIRSDQARSSQKQAIEPLPIDLGATTNHNEQSTSELYGQYIYSQLLLDCLLRMKSTPTDKNELISLCKEYYKGNDTELSIVDEFEKNYSPDQALWWYTRECFLYRLLNKAFRVLNIDLLFLFRFFICDMQQQIEKKRYLSFIRLYRAQFISKEEITLLQKSINQYVSINSYFSTSAVRDKALEFLNRPKDLERALFEIDADPQLKGTKPFVNIAPYSSFPEEKEVLLMYGTIVQIISVQCDDNKLWTVRMLLVSDEHHDSTSIINQKKNENDELETNTVTYGNILRDMGKVNEAESYYHRFLDQSSKNSKAIADCYHGLGAVAAAKNEYDISLHWYHDSLEIKMQTLQSNDPKIASSLNNIAIVHRNRGDYKQALKSCEKALVIWEKAYGEDHPTVSKCLTNIGTVYQYDKDYVKALEYYKMALSIGEKNIPCDYRSLSTLHNNIGDVHYMLNDYDLALQHFTQSLELKLRVLPNQHPNILTTFRNIGMVHEKKGDLKTASEFYQRANGH